MLVNVAPASRFVTFRLQILLIKGHLLLSPSMCPQSCCLRASVYRTVVSEHLSTEHLSPSVCLQSCCLPACICRAVVSEHLSTELLSPSMCLPSCCLPACVSRAVVSEHLSPELKNIVPSAHTVKFAKRSFQYYGRRISIALLHALKR